MTVARLAVYLVKHPNGTYLAQSSGRTKWTSDPQAARKYNKQSTAQSVATRKGCSVQTYEYLQALASEIKTSHAQSDELRHEAGDRCHVFHCMFHDHILTHPYVKSHPELLKLAGQVNEQLLDLYQKIWTKP